MILLIMGVCGVGKTTIGHALAGAIGARFIEGDDFHPVANIEKMSRGEPLEDADRMGWLAALAAELATAHQAGELAVLTCSALKQSYRDLLAVGCPTMKTVWPTGPASLIAERLRARTGHFVPANLLDSQWATFEPPNDAILVDITDPPEIIVAKLIQVLEGADA